MPSMRHFPEFDELCDMAEKAGMQIRLRASTDRVSFARANDDEYRQLTRLELWACQQLRVLEEPLATAPIYEGDLEAAARDLMQRAA